MKLWLDVNPFFEGQDIKYIIDPEFMPSLSFICSLCCTHSGQLLSCQMRRWGSQGHKKTASWTGDLIPDFLICCLPSDSNLTSYSPFGSAHQLTMNTHPLALSQAPSPLSEARIFLRLLPSILVTPNCLVKVSFPPMSGTPTVSKASIESCPLFCSPSSGKLEVS